MASDDSRQPWLPDGYAERLKVGQRVRVHLSAECEHEPDVMDGEEGTISSIIPWWANHHIYSVALDFAFPSSTEAQFAAAELVPID